MTQFRNSKAFSLFELMVVLGIIGLLASLGLPALKGISQSNSLATASRQIQDDLALARQRAISGRTTVYMVFVPPNFFMPQNLFAAQVNNMTLSQQKQLTNLVNGQYSAYALLTLRSMGDQPGRPTPRYITDWRYLPEGVVIATNKFAYMSAVNWARVPPLQRPFLYNFDPGFPFPSSKSPSVFGLPYLAFNSAGLLDRQGLPPCSPDEFIPLARASVFYPKNARGETMIGPADVKEVPPGNSTNNYFRVYVDGRTGLSRLQKLEAK